jgi:Family of unknown function (DUF6335)
MRRKDTPEPIMVTFKTRVIVEPFDGGTALESGRFALRQRLEHNQATDPRLSGGDIDAQWEMAESTGDETAGGSMPTPDQNDTDDLGEAMGVLYDPGEELHCVDKERARDTHRWELDPASSDDYLERLRTR